MVYAERFERGGETMKIENFVHDIAGEKITFDVTVLMVTDQVEIKRTEYGCSSTDIDAITSRYTDGQYDSLDRFIDGCSSILLID